MRLIVWLLRDVVYHPRGYYRIARSLSQAFSVEVWGHPMPPVEIEGTLRAHLDESVWRKLLLPPQDQRIVVQFIRGPLLRPTGPLIVCDPVGLFRASAYGIRPMVWDVWEDYEANFWHDPVYTVSQRLLRWLSWGMLSPLRHLPRAYWLAEYVYAGLTPLSRSEFYPNAFVAVEKEPPLLPMFQGAYVLYTGNLTESWGLTSLIQVIRDHPSQPIVVAGSVKSAEVAQRLRQALQGHSAWLWIHSRFVPYPVIQNLQRHARLLLAPYQALPHLRGRLFGKFYEAAALRLPIWYPEGKDPIWEAFWRRYREAPDAPELHWSFHAPRLIASVEALLQRFYERGEHF